MRSDPAAGALSDMAYHIGLAFDFSADLDYETFSPDLRTVYAVTRCLEIISEASHRLPDEMKTRHPSIAWKEMAGAGNVYRHDYGKLRRLMCGSRFRTTCRPCVL